MKDFSLYKFRCSGLSNLMTNGRKKDELLGETAKSYLRDIYIQETFGRDRSYQTISKYTKKGTMVESDSLDLVEKVTGQKYFKNAKHLENDFIQGTPDIILPERIVDIKSSWDLWTFSGVTGEQAYKDYFYQLFGYMWLTGTREADLMYCLVNTPEELIVDDLYRLSYVIQDTEPLRVNYIFDDIAPELRFKKYVFEFAQDVADQVTERVEAAREYLKGLSL